MMCNIHWLDLKFLPQLVNYHAKMVIFYLNFVVLQFPRQQKIINLKLFTCKQEVILCHQPRVATL